MILVAMPSVPSEPMKSAEQVGPGRVEPLAAEVDELAVGQHDLERRHVGHREPVLEAVGAARVLGHVAADRADLLARRIGSVVEAGRVDRLLTARFVTPGSTVTRPLSRSTSRIRFMRASEITTPSATAGRPPGEARPRAARDEREPVRVRRGAPQPEPRRVVRGSTTSAGRTR